MARFKHLNIPDHWEQYWTRYPQGYTILEALIDWASQVDKMVDNVNNWNDYLVEFVETFDEKLQPTIINELTEMYNDGRLASIINEEVFNMKADKADLDELDQQLNTALSTLEEDLNTELTNLSNQVTTDINHLNTTLDRELPNHFGVVGVVDHPMADNPVLTKESVTDVENTVFVADPFVVFDDVTNKYHMFFEVLEDMGTEQVGHVGHAYSDDGVTWSYNKIVLRDGNHFAYPNVFKIDGTWYMIPDRGGRVSGVELYRATNFPENWVLDRKLMTGGTHIDPTLVEWDGTWYMFTYTSGELSLYYADNFNSTSWTEHPQSPILTGANLRCGGNPIKTNSYFDLPLQDGRSGVYGEKLYYYRISKLNKTSIKLSRIEKEVLSAHHNRLWNSEGMHHISPIFTNRNSLPVIAVDGYNSTNKEWSIGIYTVGTQMKRPLLKVRRFTPVDHQSGEWYDVLFDNREIDTHQGWKGFPDNEYIVPQNGIYSLDCQIAFDAHRIFTSNTRILVNDVEVRTNPAPIGFTGRQCVDISDIFALKKGDRVKIQFFQNSTDPIPILSNGNSTFLSIVKVSD